jgi:drug/metabolite transporter (DMT)-like permease
MTGAIALAVAAAILIGTGDFIGGVLGRRDPTPAALVSVFGWMAAASLPLALLFGGDWTGAEIGWSIGVGMCWIVGFYALMLGIAEGRIAVVVPTAGVLSVVIPVAIDAIRGVRPSIVAGIGVAVGLVAVAIVGLSRETGGARSRRWSALMGAIGGIATGLGFTFLDQATGAGIWPIVVASSVAFVLAAGFLIATRRRVWVLPKGLVPSIALAALFLGSFAALVAAFDSGTLTVVSVVASQYPVVTLILAALIWKQKPRGVQYAGVALALLAVALISIGV